MVETSVAKDQPEKWIENSFAYDVDVKSTAYLVMTSIVICASFIILVHSNQMHCGTKYSSTRFQTDLSALCALSSGILFLICYSSPSPSKVAIMYDLLGNGLLNLTILLCDSYMFYSRLCAVIKLPKWKRTLVHIYIWTLMALVWFPVYILMAIFVNTNDLVYRRAYYISTTLVSVAILLYNFLITIEFTKILLDAYIPAIARSKTNYHDDEVPKSCQKIRVVAIKSIGHCITSCTGVLCYSFVPVYGSSLQTFILITGMHLWFNVEHSKQSWLVDMCLLNIAIFPESFFECNSVDMCNSIEMGRHVGGFMPVESGAHDPSGADVITTKNGSGVL